MNVNVTMDTNGNNRILTYEEEITSNILGR